MALARRMVTIANLLEDLGTDCGAIPVPNVTAPVLEKIIQYLQHHMNDEILEAESNNDNDNNDNNTKLDDWDVEFIKAVMADKFNMMREIINAANFLEIDLLINMSIKAFTKAQIIPSVQEMCRADEEQIRKIFNIGTKPFTAEEYASVAEEYPWIKDDANDASPRVAANYEN